MDPPRRVNWFSVTGRQSFLGQCITVALLEDLSGEFPQNRVRQLKKVASPKSNFLANDILYGIFCAVVFGSSATMISYYALLLYSISSKFYWLGDPAVHLLLFLWFGALSVLMIGHESDQYGRIVARFEGVGRGFEFRDFLPYLISRWTPLKTATWFVVEGHGSDD